jgi:PEP-CTERM motif-containing protein
MWAGEKMSYQFLWTAIQSAVVLVCLSSYAQAGLIEICKDASPAGSLSGLSTFTIAGQPGTVAVLVGACSPAIQLPDGFATITELPQAGMTLIGVSTFPGDRLISFDATTQRAVVLIVAGDISNETVITFTNAPATGVPEPGTGWLFGLGLTFCACWATRKKVAGGIWRVFLRPARRLKKKWCGGGDLNPYEIAPASTSS